jgi:hypothetical protein
VPEVNIRPIEPLAVSPKAAAGALSITTRAVYNLIADGALAARKAGARTLIDYQSLKAFYEGLPPVVSGASIPNAPQSMAQATRKAVRQ